MAAPDPEAQMLLVIVEGLIMDYRRQALEIATVRQPDHPVEREAIENLMVVLQDLEMLVSLRRGLAAPA